MAELHKTADQTLASGFYSRLGGKLGVPRIRSDRDLASLVQKRLSATAVKSLVRGGLSDGEVYHLIDWSAQDAGAPHG